VGQHVCMLHNVCVLLWVDKIKNVHASHIDSAWSWVARIMSASDYD
jgi:hypothetical protein